MCARCGTTRDLQVHGPLPLEHFVLTHQPFLQRTDRVDIEAWLDPKFPESTGEASGMPLPLEEPTANDSRHFIDAIAEEEAAFIDRKLGLGAGQELAVQVDNGHG